MAPRRPSASLNVGITTTGQPVVFSRKQRLHHTHVIGATGKGKSKFLELLLREDIQNPQCGVCLIDPHGSLYDDILHFAAHRAPQLAERIVLFDPARSTDHVLGFNPIPNNMQHSDYVIDMLVAACLKAWGQDNLDLTPRIVRWLENVFQTIIDNNLTLTEALPLLSATNRFQKEREALVARVQNEAVVEDWLMFFDSNYLQRQQLNEGTINRIRKFLRSRPIRDALGQQQHVLDLAAIMEEGKVLLVNLNGGNVITAGNTKLLGIMLVNELFRVAKLRDPRNPNLNPFFLYIDEFANFITRDIARALEECRKFKLFLILAHQHLTQLRDEDEYLYASVLTNCLNRVVFGGLSRPDATLMADEIATGFLNLHAIKDEMWSTKVRHIEETRTTMGRTEGNSTGESTSRAQSQTRGVTHGQSRGFTEGESMTRSRSEGYTETEGHADGITITQGISETLGRSEGRSSAATRGAGTSTGTTLTIGQTDQQSQTETYGRSSSATTGRSGSTSHQQGWSESQTAGASESFGSSSSTSSSQGTAASEFSSRTGDDWYDASQTMGEGQAATSSHGEQSGHSRNMTESRSTSEGRSGSRTHGHGWNESRTNGTNSSEATSTGQAHSISVAGQTSASQSRSQTNGQNSSRSVSAGTSHSQGETATRSASHGTTTSDGQARSRSRSESTGYSISRSISDGHTRTQSVTTNRSQGRTETVVPFLKPVEYRELTSRTFWTLAELEYMAVAAIKNQGVGKAFIKSGADQPHETQITHVSSTPYHPTLSPRRLTAFRQRVIAAHPQYYLPTEEAHRRQQERQLRVFPSLLPASTTDEEEELILTIDEPDGSPFT